MTIRLLLLADTHLGFDLPVRPRVERRRRGPDFFSNYLHALQPAFAGSVDIVLHAGDLFYRSKVPEALMESAMRPLVELAESGVAVYLVPGNHERSKIPLHLWGYHRNLFIFDQPRTFVWSGSGARIAFSGFPFVRKVRDHFGSLVDQTGPDRVEAQHHFLCIHQAVEGSVVGVQNYTFRAGVDVVRGRDIPLGFTAVLAGHIHRAQVLTRDLQGHPLAAPVIYPGSTERTSFVERDEQKQYAILELNQSGLPGGFTHGVQFISLPTRPMVHLELDLNSLDGGDVLDVISKELSELDPNSVVRIKLLGPVTSEVENLVSARNLRELAPATMNVDLGWRVGGYGS